MSAGHRWLQRRAISLCAGNACARAFARLYYRIAAVLAGKIFGAIPGVASVYLRTSDMEARGAYALSDLDFFIFLSDGLKWRRRVRVAWHIHFVCELMRLFFPIVENFQPIVDVREGRDPRFLSFLSKRPDTMRRMSGAEMAFEQAIVSDPSVDFRRGLRYGLHLQTFVFVPPRRPRLEDLGHLERKIKSWLTARPLELGPPDVRLPYHRLIAVSDLLKAASQEYGDQIKKAETKRAVELRLPTEGDLRAIQESDGVRDLVRMARDARLQLGASIVSRFLYLPMGSKSGFFLAETCDGFWASEDPLLILRDVWARGAPVRASLSEPTIIPIAPETLAAIRHLDPLGTCLDGGRAINLESGLPEPSRNVESVALTVDQDRLARLSFRFPSYWLGRFLREGNMPDLLDYLCLELPKAILFLHHDTAAFGAESIAEAFVRHYPDRADKLAELRSFAQRAADCSRSAVLNGLARHDEFIDWLVGRVREVSA